jgi:hypothetical protein
MLINCGVASGGRTHPSRPKSTTARIFQIEQSVSLSKQPTHLLGRKLTKDSSPQHNPRSPITQVNFIPCPAKTSMSDRLHGNNNFTQMFLAVGFAGIILVSTGARIEAQQRRVPPGGRIAVVVDTRLAALRAAPNPSATLVRRLGRGRFVSIRSSQRTADGLLFHRVLINRRTSGWLQGEAVIASWHPHDDERLLHLIVGPDEFERAARAKYFSTLSRAPR